jgi:hypothetical protein
MIDAFENASTEKMTKEKIAARRDDFNSVLNRAWLAMTDRMKG